MKFAETALGYRALSLESVRTQQHMRPVLLPLGSQIKGTSTTVGPKAQVNA
jgi:hypothetical protein